MYKASSAHSKSMSIRSTGRQIPLRKGKSHNISKQLTNDERSFLQHNKSHINSLNDLFKRKI